MSEHISRRELIAAGGAAIATAAIGSGALADTNAKPPVKMGTGHWTYEVVDGWGVLPAPMSYGMGCGVVVDSKDRVYVHTRCMQAVAVFDRHGRLLTTWGAEYVGYAHGLYWSKEGKDEFLYFTTNSPGDFIVKTDLNGKIVMRIGTFDDSKPNTIPWKFRNPTDVAIAPNGDIYTCEGYGSQLVNRFDKNGKHLKTIGGPGVADDKFNVCHGMWVDTRAHKEPEVYVADRANGRLQVFTPELTFKRSLKGDPKDPVVRNPCCFYTHKDFMYVPDLDHRVTILDTHDQVVAQLGDGRGKDKGGADDPSIFRLPHALCTDSHGDMYVVEWLPTARLRKLKHTPA